MKKIIILILTILLMAFFINQNYSSNLKDSNLVFKSINPNSNFNYYELTAKEDSFITYTYTDNLLYYILKNNQDYELYTLNLNLSYIDYYNHGNLYYQKEEYENAIDRYEIALTKNPPKKRVCDIRINLSLATVKLAIMKEDASYLKKAREILYQDDCAHEEDDTGSSKNAEKLEQEIKELEKNVVGEDPENPDPNEDPNPDPEIPNEENIEEQLKKEIIQNNQIRNENIQTWENLNNYEYYNGKSW